MDKRLQTFEEHRPLLFSIAYRMLGSVMEAEDAVQETYLRYMATDVDAVQSPKAFLSTVITRFCLDQLKSARVQREEYFGPWLPEPLLTADAPDELLARHESISMAFLLLLETLSPVERAVFLLREVFEYDYGAIAAIVGKSEANCRQLHSRAKKHIQSGQPRFVPSGQEQQQLVGKLLHAMQRGDSDTFATLLAEDVELRADGGGKVTSATHPLLGRQVVMRFLTGLYKKRPPGSTVELTEVNAAPAWVVRVDGKVDSVMSFELGEREIRGIRIIRNPEKLRHLQ
ncbi:MAG: RNA polymerase sigma-70 factor [Caldilineaceae bacterium]|nr:RNA polymerase sigma-70 factor [Caldilineaceae bacterium]